MSVNPEAGGGTQITKDLVMIGGVIDTTTTETMTVQRERERRNSDRSEDGYHSDGDYGEHDYRHDISDERESKTIMLRGLPITITESDIREMMESFEGPQPADVRLMKRKTGVSRGFAFVEFITCKMLPAGWKPIRKSW